MPEPARPLPERATVIIPCFNAGSRVSRVVEGVLASTKRIVIVDDGSTDGCLARMAGSGLHIVRHEHNRGKGHAILTGLRAALSDPQCACAAFMDADGQHDPAQLPALYEGFESERADLLIGARDLSGTGVPLASRAGNFATAAITRALLPRTVSDTQSGFRLCSRRFGEYVLANVHGGRYETEMEMLLRALLGDWKVAERPIPTLYEAGNPSSHFAKVSDSARIYLRMFDTLRRIRREG